MSTRSRTSLTTVPELPALSCRPPCSSTSKASTTHEGGTSHSTTTHPAEHEALHAPSETHTYTHSSPRLVRFRHTRPEEHDIPTITTRLQVSVKAVELHRPTAISRTTGLTTSPRSMSRYSGWRVSRALRSGWRELEWRLQTTGRELTGAIVQPLVAPGADVVV